MSGVERPRRATFADVVDPRRNALNLVRLLLATSVVLWHSFTLSGADHPLPALAQPLGSVAVDGFFAISGFLLAGSWLRRPHLPSYVRNRVLRLMPAFWVCLAVVAFVFAPLSAALQGRGAGSLFGDPHGPVQHVLHNAALWMQFYDVAGTPRDVPLEGVWNGSLWTLRWEAFAYAGLAVFALLGGLRRRAAVVALFVVIWLVNVGLMTQVLPDAYPYWTQTGGRLGLMFAAGMLLHAVGHRIPATGAAALVALGLLVVSPVLPDYRVLGGLPLAYLVLWCGGRLRGERLQLKNWDLSYGTYIYAFPVQQVLVMLGGDRWSVPAFAAASLAGTLPLALASWVLVERPALRMKSRRSRRPAPPDSAAPPHDHPPMGRDPRLPEASLATDGGRP